MSIFEQHPAPLVDIRDLRVQPPPPPRWKQALVIFLVFYPLSTAVNWLSGATSLGDPGSTWVPSPTAPSSTTTASTAPAVRRRR